MSGLSGFWLFLADSLRPDDPAGLFYSACKMLAWGGAVCFVLRSVYVITGRLFGFYAPSQYWRWPRLIPWRVVYRAWARLSGWYERVFWPGRRGANGGFAGVMSTLCLPFRPGMVHLGRAHGLGLAWLQPVGIIVRRHLFMLAQTGSGKTTALITLISEYRGSVFLIDPKSQIIDRLAKSDTRRRWYVFDPYGISGHQSVHFNVFDLIKAMMAASGEGAAVLWAMRVSEALVVTPAGNKSVYFYDTSRQFLAGLILHILSAHDEDEHHLPFTRDLIVNGYRVFEEGRELTRGDEAMQLLMKAMAENTAFDGVIAGAVSALRSASGETAGNVMSTLQEQTKFLDLPDVRAVLRRSDFDLRDLKRRDDVALAFSAPIYSLREELSRLARLLTNMTCYVFEAEKQKKGSCLMAIDELPSQRYNPTIEVTLAVARSMGITFLGVAQSAEQMKQHYPGSYKSFIGEADAVLWMGANHPDNAALLSRLLGQTTRIIKDKKTGRKERREIPVMDAEQAARYLDPNSNRLIVTRAGARALRLVNEPYFKALPVWRYAPDPDHKEAPARRFTRFLCAGWRLPSRMRRRRITP